jgi:hypothetical protein
VCGCCCCASAAGGYDSDLEGALASGHVGSPIQAADRALLRLRPLRHYAAGELVAVKRRSNSAAATASASAVTTAAGDGGSGEVEGVTLCYGRVAVDAGPATGQAAYRLSVEVEPGVYETLLSTQVRFYTCTTECRDLASLYIFVCSSCMTCQGSLLMRGRVDSAEAVLFESATVQRCGMCGLCCC